MIHDENPDLAGQYQKKARVFAQAASAATRAVQEPATWGPGDRPVGPNGLSRLARSAGPGVESSCKLGLGFQANPSLSLAESPFLASESEPRPFERVGSSEPS